jgi:hypothetical protein
MFNPFRTMGGFFVMHDDQTQTPVTVVASAFQARVPAMSIAAVAALINLLSVRSRMGLAERRDI